MISKKDNEDSWLIKFGAVIPFGPNGNDRRSLETVLSEVLRGYKWYLAFDGNLLYVEQESLEQIKGILSGVQVSTCVKMGRA